LSRNKKKFFLTKSKQSVNYTIMIETTLLEDKPYYSKEQLRIMRAALSENFILSDRHELTEKIDKASPEIRILINFLINYMPELLFKALGEDLYQSLRNEFITAFTNPNSEKEPTLVFQFEGGNSSYQFRVTSKNRRIVEEAARCVVDGFMDVIGDENPPLGIEQVHIFEYKNNRWEKSI